MFKLTKRLIVLSLLLQGCSDYKLHTIPEKPVPEIDVTPTGHDFGALSAGHESQDLTVTIKNIGTANLDVSSIILQNGTSNFSLSTVPTAPSIDPNSQEELIVTYSPGTYETNSDVISIYSNDEDEPVVNVYLDGSGDAPIITITPDYYEFSNVYLGCQERLPVQIGNIGNANLILNDLEFFATLPADFSIEDYESDWGSIPIVIPPGDVIDLYVDYAPTDGYDDGGYIKVESNDPVTPVVFADQDGSWDYESWSSDKFEQDGIVDVDILFVVDNSGSMISNQMNLKNNFDSFISAFSAAGASYNIGIITTDSKDFMGPIITEMSADPISEFNDQIDAIGTGGSTMEKGLWYAYESTTSGDAAPGASSGFFRNDARLVVVYVSDERDWSHNTSHGGGGSSMTFSDYTSALLGLKSSSDLVVAHAIAGDYPSGCSGNGNAQFGEGYYDVVSDLGGTFMSICASDWSATMDTLARESLSITAFPLTGKPIEHTIQAYVDGILSTDWTYNETENTVTFTSVPPEGSEIIIDYANWSCI